MLLGHIKLAQKSVLRMTFIPIIYLCNRIHSHKVNYSLHWGWMFVSLWSLNTYRSVFVAGENLIDDLFAPTHLLLLRGRDSCHPSKVAECSPCALRLVWVPPDALGQCDPVIDCVDDLVKHVIKVSNHSIHMLPLPWWSRPPNPFQLSSGSRTGVLWSCCPRRDLDFWS